MKKNIFLALALVASLSACNDDYTDWAAPQKNDPEAAITIPGFTSSATSAIDLNSVEADSSQVLSLSTATLPDGYSLGIVRIELTPDDNSADATTVSTSVDGKAANADLQALVENVYGRKPTARTFSGHVYADAIKDGEAILIDAGTINVVVTPEAPEVEAKYYITGGINGWDNANTDYLVTNSGKDPYEDQVFTIKLTADQVDEGFEFKLTPESKIGTGDSNSCLSLNENGDDGKFAYDNVGGNLKVNAVDGAKLYILTFNMLDKTWSVETKSFNQYIYEVGKNTNWATGPLVPLAGPNYDGKYTGYAYLNGAFKFKPNDGNDWSGDWEMITGGTAYEGTISESGDSDIPAPDAGFYKMDVDLAEMTYKLTAVNTIGVIGSATPNGWADETDFTYNVADNSWTGTVTLTDGEIKFRANHDDKWTINWGGSLDNLTQGGGDIAVTAGTYEIKLVVVCEGKSYATLTKK